jgi:ribosomal protein S18 acetylase RimI-like enzyme
MLSLGRTRVEGAHETRVDVRLATEADLDLLAVVERQVFGTDAYDRAELLRLLESEDCLIHVAEADGALAGFAVTALVTLRDFASRYELPLEKLPHRGERAGQRIAYFKSLGVRPGYRRRGVGRKLHEARISLLPRLGVDSIFLIQMPNADLPAFHAVMGFSRLDVEPNRRFRSGERGSVWHRSVVS